MPLYSFLCPNGHRTERYDSMATKNYNTITCDTCMEKAGQEYSPLGTTGGQISDATRKLLEVPFGKKKANEFRYTKDISEHVAKKEQEMKSFGKGLGSGAKD